MVALISHDEVSKKLINVPRPYTMDNAEQWLDLVHKQDLILNIFIDDHLIGGVSLKLEEDGCYELGYWLGIDYWGYGYATEAVKGLLDYAAQKLNSLQIKANVSKENTTSIKRLENNRFKKVIEQEAGYVFER